MTDELIIPQNFAQAIVWQVLTSTLVSLQTRTDIRKQQLLQLMQNYLDETVNEYLNTLNKKLDKLT